MTAHVHTANPDPHQNPASRAEFQIINPAHILYRGRGLILIAAEIGAGIVAMHNNYVRLPVKHFCGRVGGLYRHQSQWSSFSQDLEVSAWLWFSGASAHAESRGPLRVPQTHSLALFLERPSECFSMPASVLRVQLCIIIIPLHSRCC